MSRFIENFKTVEDIIKEYQISEDALDGAEILLAWYGYGSYEDGSFVLYKKDGKLFEVHGSHCSCYGLEGQWEPEETNWDALAMRKIDYYGGSDVAQAKLTEVIEQGRKL